MQTRGHAARRFMPVVGGVTAAATAVGAWAPAVQIAGAQPDGATASLGAAAARGAGVFESCSTYFGFGKDEGVLEVVAFDVADQNGADGVDHAVPDDVGVVLVLETTEGGTIECTPVEVTEEEWDDEYGGAPYPEWPGAGHYAYPSVNLQGEIEELPAYGEVTDVGFRVTGIPGGHTLVSPEDVQALVQHYLDLEELFDEGIIDPRVLALIDAEAGATAAADYEAFFSECYTSEETVDPSTDPDVIAAVEAVIAYFEGEPDELTEVECFQAAIVNVQASELLAAFATTEYTEQIVLALPEAPEPEPAPAAQPATAAPQFTG